MKNEKSITAGRPSRSILVTDSGIGGMSVFNDIANRLSHASPWPKVRLTYFNAWPAPHRGYNHFGTEEKKAQVFDRALDAMQTYRPDEILIACNTLSVIYQHTRFAAAAPVRVQGIVEYGVQMIFEKLTADPDGIALVFGTPTTVDARTHEQALRQRGIAEGRIISVGCPNLAGRIEREPFGEAVDRMIRVFVKEAADRLGPLQNNVYAALCCTHFGYRRDLFEQALAACFSGKAFLLNPNDKMAEEACRTSGRGASYRADIRMHIVSQAVWEAAQINAYLRLLSPALPATKQALMNYEQNSGLFSVD